MIVLKNEQDYDYALWKLEKLWDDSEKALQGSPDYDYFSFLCDAIHAYEELHHRWEDEGGKIKEDK